MDSRKRVKRFLLISILILLIAIVSVGAYYFSAFSSAMSEIHQPIKRNLAEKEQKPIVLEEKEPFSVLLMGVDQREGDKGRSDTLIFLTVNPTEQSIKMSSIPRDTMAEIVGKGVSDKINHAFAFGGIAMTLDTVEYFLGVPIDYYVKVNMEAFQGFVDNLGGILVNNPLEFTEAGKHFAKGEITLTGDETMLFVRMRKQDPNGDFGRQERQREVIKGILRKGASLESITKLDKILNTLGENVKTDLSFGELVDIHKHYKQTINNIESLELPGQGRIENGIYYYFVDEAEKEKIQEIFQKHLDGD